MFNIKALSKNDGEIILWKSRIPVNYAGIWSAVIDEKRKLLLISYHWHYDYYNFAPVDIYTAIIRNWSLHHAPSIVKMSTRPQFHRQDWQCYGMTIMRERDLILISDWYHGKIGIWSLASFGEQQQDPIIVIQKSSFISFNFSPTCCALLPVNNWDSESQDFYLAVSDFRQNAVYLLKLSFFFDSQEIRYDYLATLATAGSQNVGLVRGPGDLKFDLSTGILVVTDQFNRRVQVKIRSMKFSIMFNFFVKKLFIPNNEWPKFRAESFVNSLDGQPISIAIKQRIGDELLVLAGLNSGQLIRCNFALR